MITSEHMTGTCGDCGDPIAEWNKIGYCRNCRNRNRKKPYSEEYDRGWRRRHQANIALKNARVRAKDGGYPCTITTEDISPVAEQCESCGITMERFGDWQIQPSLDRIVPDLGYIPENVAWICRRCNQVKNNGTLEELRTVVAYIERHVDAHANN